MLIVALNEISVTSRQRTDIATKGLNELAWSIEFHGLIQLPGVWKAPNSDKFELVWGERRYRAVTQLAAQGKSIRLTNGDAIPLGSVPVLLVGEAAGLLRRQELEFEENIQREELPWANRVAALAKIHQLRLLENPAQTVEATAREISAKTGISMSTLRQSAGPTASANSIPIALALAPHLTDPEVIKATSVASAYAIVTRKSEEAAVAALVRKRTARGIMDNDPIRLLCGDARKLMLEVPNESVDLICTDPPYGVNADADNFSRRQTQKHTYVDDPNTARAFMQFLLTESWRVAKNRANIFMFVDSKHYDWLRETAERAAWAAFPVPIIWDKMSPGIGPWQDNGFGRSYEMIFFATKGRRGLHTPLRDVLPHKRVPDTERHHAAQKPDSLLRQLIAASTIHGDLVLDPCAGSGSTLIAARALNRRALGFEIDRALYEGAVTNLFQPKEKISE